MSKNDKKAAENDKNLGNDRPAGNATTDAHLTLI